MRYALILVLASCGEQAPKAAPAEAKPEPGKVCAHDRECVAPWHPGVRIPSSEGMQTQPVCAGVERCVEGRCTTPGAVSGVASSATGQVVFDVAEGAKTFHVEVVRDAFETSRGLMCRTSMKPDWGMLFVMSARRVQRFWMKNTLIPLDMVFVDEDWSVVGVVHGAQPLNLNGHGVGKPSRYVLELNSGVAKRAGIVAGARMRFIAPTGG